MMLIQKNSIALVGLGVVAIWSSSAFGGCTTKVIGGTSYTLCSVGIHAEGDQKAKGKKLGADLYPLPYPEDSENPICWLLLCTNPQDKTPAGIQIVEVPCDDSRLAGPFSGYELATRVSSNLYYANSHTSPLDIDDSGEHVYPDAADALHEYCPNSLWTAVSAAPVCMRAEENIQDNEGNNDPVGVLECCVDPNTVEYEINTETGLPEFVEQDYTCVDPNSI